MFSNSFNASIHFKVSYSGGGNKWHSFWNQRGVGQEPNSSKDWYFPFSFIFQKIKVFYLPELSFKPLNVKKYLK